VHEVADELLDRPVEHLARARERIGIVDDPHATFTREPCGAMIDGVLGQPDFGLNGENRVMLWAVA
jgi:hypothetical protein